MQIKVQLVVCGDDGHEETHTDVLVLEKACQRIEQLGLALAESKQLLKTLQQYLVEQQATAFVRRRACCQACGQALRTKGHHTVTFRTLFGTITLNSPRLRNCRCASHKTTSVSPLVEVIFRSTAPELLFMETKWASLVSYGLTVAALKDFLPVDETLSVSTVRSNTLAVAQRCEAELGEEQGSFIEGCPRDWGNLPLPDGPLTVGIDGGYVRNWEAKQRHFEVIVGKSMLACKREEDTSEPSSKCFGFVQNYDSKSKRRLFEVLQSQGLQMNQPVTFLSDGGDTVRDLQLSLSPEAEHILDWFHVTMRLTVLDQYGKGLVHHDQQLGAEIREKIERLKWSLWHGQVDKALGKIDDLASSIGLFQETYARFTQLVKAL